MQSALYTPSLKPKKVFRARYTEQDLIAEFQGAMNRTKVEEQVLGVRDVLVAAIKEHPGFLPARYTGVTQDCYARRPLYIDPAGRFSVVVMTWGAGQGTPLHDHGGLWVVECLYEGRIKVTNFERTGESNGLHQFQRLESVHARPGDADHRIPPDDHHIVESDQADPSVSIHVFGGSLDHCNVFEPAEGGYLKSNKKMAFTGQAPHRCH
jgi:predicted metal-dependent enzyme (double-stranded beta helix superfamily)